MNIVKHLPNSITLCNLLCGCLAIVLAFNQLYDCALLIILLGGVFDFCDGLVARQLKAYSAIGKELDSLSDLVTFGVAPAFVGFNFASSNLNGVYLYLAYIPFLIPLFSALRLAKFNLDQRQLHTFLGLPTPASAITFVSLIATLSFLMEGNLVSSAYFKLSIIMVLFMSLLLSALLISEIPMFSLKLSSLSYKENKALYLFLALVLTEIILTSILGLRYSLLIFFILVTYISYNLLLTIIQKIANFNRK